MNNYAQSGNTSNRSISPFNYTSFHTNSRINMSGVGKHDRKRSARACRECHRGKIKCDMATVGSPCTRCQQKGLANCEILPSLRGKYDRRKKNLKLSAAINSRSDTIEPKINQETIATDFVPVDSRPPESSIFSPEREALLAAQGSLSPFDARLQNSPNSGGSIARSNQNNQEESKRETWELSFTGKNSNELCFRRQRITFLGESSPLSMLLRKMTDSGHIEILLPPDSHRINSPGDSSVISPNSSAGEVKAGSSPADDLPKHALELFLESYFTYIHPFYPIVDCKWFAKHYSADTVPALLLNAMCFAACYHCPISTVFSARFASLRAAKEAFYQYAKLALVTQGWPEPGVAIQTAILLSFQGAGTPGDVWNTGTWIGLAVSMAEDHGLHRSTLQANLNPKDKQLFKVIWWVLVFRDTMTSLTLGRPNKISMQDCDVDLLNLEDFNHDFDPENGETLFGRRDERKHEMLIEICKLNVLMGELTRIRFKPRDPEVNHTADIQIKLDAWRAALPARLDWCKSPQAEEAMYLNMLYQHLIIYMYRPRLADSEILEDFSLAKTIEAASEIAVIVGKLGMKNILAIPQDFYSVFVTAMVVLAVDIRSKAKQGLPCLSSTQLQVCMLTMNQALDHWDQAPWVVKMFEKLQQTLDETEKHQDTEAVSPMIYDFEKYANNSYLEDYFDLLQTVIPT